MKNQLFYWQVSIMKTKSAVSLVKFDIQAYLYNPNNYPRGGGLADL